jgi:hypothetical protein
MQSVSVDDEPTTIPLEELMKITLKERKAIAHSLTQTIQLSCLLSSQAINGGGRDKARQILGAKVSRALLVFSEYFDVIFAELDPDKGVVVSVLLVDGSSVVVPLTTLSIEAQQSLHGTIVSYLQGGETGLHGQPMLSRYDRLAA